jgi:hypothetical protein
MQYKILKKYYLVDYDMNMDLLYNDLKQLLAEKFPSGTIDFASDERLLFYHQDLDYFVNDQFPGFTLYNLQLILRELDIPNFFCAVISNMPDYIKYTSLVRDTLRPDDLPIRAASIIDVDNVVLHMSDYIPISVNSIDQPFIVMSRLARFHRTFFMSKLFKNGLQNQGLVAYHNISADKDCYEIKNANLSSGPLNRPSFLTTIPFTRSNNETMLYQASNRQLVQDFQRDVFTYVNFNEDHNINDKSLSMHLQNNTLCRALVYVALETVVQYPKVFVSNISFKGIANKRPFVIFGVPGTLSYLKSLGFKTFDSWWDESYDQELNIEKRTDMIIQLLNTLTQYTIPQLSQMCSDMNSILDHNYNLLKNQIGLRHQQHLNDILTRRDL